MLNPRNAESLCKRVRSTAKVLEPVFNGKLKAVPLVGVSAMLLTFTLKERMEAPGGGTKGVALMVRTTVAVPEGGGVGPPWGKPLHAAISSAADNAKKMK